MASLNFRRNKKKHFVQEELIQDLIKEHTVETWIQTEQYQNSQIRNGQSMVEIWFSFFLIVLFSPSVS